MVVDNMTRENYIPIDFVKSGDSYSSLFHNIETEAYIDSNKTNSAYLVGWSYDTLGW